MTITITTPGRSDVLVDSNDLLLGVIAHAKSLTNMATGDVHAFTASNSTHAIDGTITAGAAPEPHRVEMIFRELLDPGGKNQPDISVKLINAVSVS